MQWDYRGQKPRKAAGSSRLRQDLQGWNSVSRFPSQKRFCFVLRTSCAGRGRARRYLKLRRSSPLCGWGEQNTDDPQPVNSPSTAAHQRCELIVAGREF